MVNNFYSYVFVHMTVNISRKKISRQPPFWAQHFGQKTNFKAQKYLISVNNGSKMVAPNRPKIGVGVIFFR